MRRQLSRVQNATASCAVESATYGSCIARFALEMTKDKCDQEFKVFYKCVLKKLH